MSLRILVPGWFTKLLTLERMITAVVWLQESSPEIKKLFAL